MAPSRPSTDADDFVNVWTDSDFKSNASEAPNSDFYGQWVDQSSQKKSIPPITGANALRKLYPKHSLVMTNGYGMNLLGFPAASVTPLDKTPLITNMFFVPLSRSMGIPGILIDQVQFGGFNVGWNQYEFIVYTIQYPEGFGSAVQYFILHQGPEDAARLFLLSAGAWVDSLHDEIWVFNQGYWQKSRGLWSEVQKADWKDVILKEEFKKALQKDIYGFFASESIYKELAIPWKRGLIMYGPPGNGKTISLKTVMKTCGDKGFAPLYVKSFQSWKGEEGAMADVFDKARQLSPCVIILEDLDSLINDRNRSFFLNQLDGLEGNDGLLVIGTTNHFDRLDPGLSSRPSRFDRKYKFDDPDEEERKLYVQYWQHKLISNKDIDFPDRLVNKVARITDRFSFAYLKEAFVSSLVTIAGIEGDKPAFEGVLFKQIETLRKQLDKAPQDVRGAFHVNVASLDDDIHYDSKSPFKSYSTAPARPPRPDSSKEYKVHELLNALSESAPRTNAKMYRTSTDSISASSRLEQHQASRNFKNLLDDLSLSNSLQDQTQTIVPRRIFETGQSDRFGNIPPQDNERQRIREYLNTISAETTQPNEKLERLYSQSPFHISPSDWSRNPVNMNSHPSGSAAQSSVSNPSIWK